MQIKVFGESHFINGEVLRVRQQIIASKPTIILLENFGDDKSFYEKYTNARVLQLEPEFKETNKTLLQQFLIREKIMIGKIREVISNAKEHDIICVQLGDTHLRTIYSKELGFPNLYDALKQFDGIDIFRSKHKEID